MKFQVAVLLLLAVNGCFAAKIVMMPMFGPSHFLVLAKLGEELGRRGHEVYICINILFISVSPAGHVRRVIICLFGFKLT